MGMEINCKTCKYAYSYELYGSKCPKCGAENEPFRSAVARRSMGYETDSLRSHAFTDDHAQRQEALYRETGPFVPKKKGPLGRIKPYLFILMLMFGVAALGSALLSMSQSVKEEPFASNGAPKPLIESLASSIYEQRFNTLEGVTITVTCQGWLQGGTKLEELLQGNKGVFVNLVAEAETPGMPLPGTFSALVGESRVYQGDFRSAARELTSYTPLNIAAFEKKGSAMGQIFFSLPTGTEKFYLCWRVSQADIEQRMEIEL